MRKKTRAKRTPDNVPPLDVSALQRAVQGEGAAYNQHAVEAINSCEASLVPLDLPFIVLRKFKGILNAIEMQVEDFAMTPAVLTSLCRAYKAQASIFKEPYRTPILDAFQACEEAILSSFSELLSQKEMSALRMALMPISNSDTHTTTNTGSRGS